MKPLVSVMMPAFNAGKTIRFALASLQAQTYENWECIVVDDGSNDNTVEVVETIEDDRIKLIKLPNNRGRGIVRQIALEAARGDFLAMLDSDDWIYPEKLSLQVEKFQNFPQVSLVGAGMSIFGPDNKLVGVRGMGNGLPHSISDPINIPFTHAPSMFRAKELTTFKYDPKMKLGQDVDFLRHYMQGKRYLILPDILYAYGELESVNIKKMIMGTIYNMRGISKFFFPHPMSVSLNLFISFFKIPIFTICAIFGKESYLIARRSSPCTRNNRIEYEHARNKISSML